MKIKVEIKTTRTFNSKEEYANYCDDMADAGAFNKEFWACMKKLNHGSFISEEPANGTKVYTSGVAEVER